MDKQMRAFDRIDNIRNDCEVECFAFQEDTILWHYTNIDALFGIIQNESIWLNDARYMNDKSEIVSACSVIRKTCKKLSSRLCPVLQDAVSESLEELESLDNFRILLASFTTQKDALNQWKGYAGNRNGVSIGFRSTRIRPAKKINTDSPLLIKALYSPKDKVSAIETFLTRVSNHVEKVRETIEGSTEVLSTIVSSYFSICMISFKDECWRDESEIRLALPHDYSFRVEYRVNNGHIIPYGKQGIDPKRCIESVITIDNDALKRKALAAFLDARKIKADVQKSSIEYRFF